MRLGIRVFVWAAAVCFLGTGCSSAGENRTARVALLASTTSTSTVHQHSSTFTGRKPIGRSDDGRYLTLIDTDTVQVSQEPNGTTPTAELVQHAEAFRVATVATMLKFRDIAVARAAGYQQVLGDAYHWVKPELLDDSLHSDPTAPESLIYYDLGDQKLSIIGVMYLEPGVAHGREVGGVATAWHYHDYPKPFCVVSSGFPVGSVDADGRCEAGERADRSPEMLHVWLTNPDGPFSAQIFVPRIGDWRIAMSKLAR